MVFSVRLSRRLLISTDYEFIDERGFLFYNVSLCISNDNLNSIKIYFQLIFSDGPLFL